LAELNTDVRTELMDQFQTRWVNEWRPANPWYAKAARHVVAPNVGGYDTIAGPWLGHGDRSMQRKLFFVDK
jgi:hypothetical protein